jgi:hypothetical protein
MCYMIAKQSGIEHNIDTLLDKVPALQYVLNQLAETGIRYGLYAGSHVAVLVNNREPTDVDLIVHDDDLPALRALFPFARTKDLGRAVYLYIGECDAIEFMGRADILRNGKAYPFRLTDLAAEHVRTYTAGRSKIKLVDPVDTLLLKALLRRGQDQGKHDLEDLEAVLNSMRIDQAYLTARLCEVNALDATQHVWRAVGIHVQ